MKDLGMITPGQTIYIEFDSFGADGESLTLTGLALADVKVYKNGGTTERASTSGFTLLDTDGIDFDTLTGIHGLSIDLADNTTTGFWEAGAHYRVVIDSVTINTQTVRFTAATFRIGYPAALLNTSIATLSTQTSFTLTDGPAEDDALNGLRAFVHDVASKVQLAQVIISDYVGSTKTVTLAAAPGFTIAATDSLIVMPQVAQTGDSFARLGAPAGASIAADLVAIDNFVDDLESRLTAARAGYLDNLNGHTAQTGDSFARLGAPAGASVSADIADVPTVSEFNARTLPAASYFDPAADTVANVTTVATTTTNSDMRGTDNALLASTWSAVMAGITSLAEWLGILAGKQTGNATARTEIRATGAGSGTYDETTDSLEAIKDAALSGTVDANVTQWLGSAAATPTVAGVPEVDITHVSGSAVTGGTPDVNVVQISGDSVAADNAEAFFDGTGYAGTNNVIPTVTTLTGHTAQTADHTANIAAIVADTNELQTDLTNGGRLDVLIDQIITDIAALNDLSAAQVATEISDALNTDAVAEPGSVPAANAALSTKLSWLYMVARNKITTTATTQIVKADDTTTTVGTSTVSDDGTTFTRGEYA